MDLDTMLKTGIMWNMCRCCLNTNKCEQNMFSEHLSSGQLLVYEIMLKEVFNIQMSQEESRTKSSALICDECISKLQQASAFKEMVVRSEQAFAAFLKGLQYDKEHDSRLRSVKTESRLVDEESDITCDDDDVTAGGDETDETPSAVKQLLKGDKRVALEDAVIRNNTKAHDHRKADCAVEKESMGADDATISDTDWEKITERRGNGPVLRENSLKLLKSSTLCVFQWHKSKYTCFCCRQPFVDMENLRQHTATQHSLQDIEKKIISQQNMLVKVEVSVLKCKLCCQPLEDLPKLREHLSTDHNFQFRLKEDLLVPFKIQGDVLQCQMCFEKFALFRLLNIHMNGHFKKQVCHVCGAAFSSLRFLNLHKSRTHRRLFCKQCDQEFQTKTEKRKHDAAVHKVLPVRKLRFPCPHCEERFFQESFKVLHLVDKHGMKRPEHKCSVCPKSFVTKSLCNNHVKSVHMKERRHTCEVCHNRFYTRSDVTRHKVTHTGEKRFSCAQCNGPFATKDSLRRHMKRTHSVH